MSLHVIILAAGQGTRMCSSKPKVAHTIAGVPMLTRVVDTALTLDPAAIHVVYGFSGEALREQFQDLPVDWVFQEKQLGTAHGVLKALPACESADHILVLYGDVPLTSTATLRCLSQDVSDGLGVLVTEAKNPKGFGRIIRDEAGHVQAIVEEKDATETQRTITEVNTGIMYAKADLFRHYLPLIDNKNAQEEYYLTDIVGLCVQGNRAVSATKARCEEEVLGVNDRQQQMQLERYYQYQYVLTLSKQGVTFMDPRRVDFRGADVVIGQDSTVDVNVIFEGHVHIGKNVTIGPNTIIKQSRIEDNVVIHANSMIDGSTVSEAAQVGPFARIRPGSVLGKQSKVGNFVELKNTVLGHGSKASHLSYLGDTTIGKAANIGAGTITCNYDGKKKSHTVLGDGVFVGSNTSLIAPLIVAGNVLIGAGSVITQDVPEGHLALSRSEQKNKPRHKEDS